MLTLSVAEVAQLVSGKALGGADLRLSRIGPLATADIGTISFLSHPRYRAQLDASAAGCVLVQPGLHEAVVHRPSAVLVDDPYHAFALLTQWWARHARPSLPPGIHRSAVVEEGAFIHATAHVGAMSYVGPDAQIGEGAVVAPQAHVGREASVGAHTRLMPRAMLLDGCRIGKRGLVHGGAVIGADGFGFAPHAGHWVKIEQLGAVVIGDDVEIGANTCIDRGALEDTVIEEGVKLDNLVQIGHNVRIGAHSAFAGCVGVAGSAKIGRHCTAGGGAIILGHLELADHVHVTAGTVITRSIHKPGQYSGLFPFDDNRAWEKNAATLRQLHALRERLRALEMKI